MPPSPTPSHQASINTSVAKSLEGTITEINALIKQYNQISNDVIRKDHQLNDVTSRLDKAQTKLTDLNGQIKAVEENLLVRKLELEAEVEQKAAESQEQLESERSVLQSEKQNHQNNLTELKKREDSLIIRENELISSQNGLKDAEISLHQRQDQFNIKQKALDDKLAALDDREAAVAPKEKLIAEKLHKITEDVTGIAKDRDEIKKLLKQGQNLLAEAHLKMSAAKAQELRLANQRKIMEGKQLDLLKLSKALKTKETQLNDRANILNTHATDFNI